MARVATSAAAGEAAAASIADAYLPRLLAVAALYFGTAWLSDRLLTFVGDADLITPVWLPSGVALAALLLFGYRYWPAILLGHLLLYASAWPTPPLPPLTAALTSVGNLLAALLATFLLRFVGFRYSLDRLVDVVRLFAIGGLLGPAVSAIWGVAALALTGLFAGTDVVGTWITWWAGNKLGVLTVAPLLLTWSASRRQPLTLGRRIELVALGLALLASGALVFGLHLFAAYVTFPAVVWAAVRFGPRGAASAVLTMTALAIWATTHGRGPFAGPVLTENLMGLDLYTAVIALTALIVAATVSERQHAEHELATRELQQAIVRHELAHAWDIQRRLLPVALVGWPGHLDLAVRFRPALETSGDFYHVLALAPLTADAAPGAASAAPAGLQIAVGDVAGKGIAAALVMALARATLATIAETVMAAAVRRPDGGTAPAANGAAGPAADTATGPAVNGAVARTNGSAAPAANGAAAPAADGSPPTPSPAHTLRRAGSVLHRDVGRRDFVACALAVVDPPSEPGRGPRLRLANAAQVPPILCRAGGAQELEPPGERLPLGVLPEAEYDELAIALQPGDVVLFTSDGMVEAPARGEPAGDGALAPAESYTTSGAYPPPSAMGELFGFERLLASAAHWSARAADPDDVAAGVWADLTAWCGETSQHDDMTLLVMRVPGEPAPG
jgi:integral membrane sensor domain MASE1